MRASVRSNIELAVQVVIDYAFEPSPNLSTALYDYYFRGEAVTPESRNVYLEPDSYRSVVFHMYFFSLVVQSIVRMRAVGGCLR